MNDETRGMRKFFIPIDSPDNIGYGSRSVIVEYSDGHEIRRLGDPVISPRGSAGHVSPVTISVYVCSVHQIDTVSACSTDFIYKFIVLTINSGICSHKELSHEAVVFSCVDISTNNKYINIFSAEG
jgi:hypothetical protein